MYIMKQLAKIACRHCESDDLVKDGHSENGTQRYRCNNCKKSFQIEYSYNAWKPGTKEQIEKQTLNSSGVRDISRNLEISKNTVISELKKTPIEINPFFIKPTFRTLSLKFLILRIICMIPWQINYF